MTINSFLSQDEIKFVKTISFSITVGGVLHPANIVYTRKLSSEYQMKQDDTSSKRLYYEIKEKACPNDEIDEFILESIRKIYTNATVRSSILLFNTKLDEYKQKLSEDCVNTFVIRVNPNIDQAIKSSEKEWKGFYIKLQLFCNSNDNHFFQDSFSNIEYNVADKKNEFDDFWQKLKNNVGSILI